MKSRSLVLRATTGVALRPLLFLFSTRRRPTVADEHVILNTKVMLLDS